MRMPAVFLGHGSPMNAVQRNRYTQAWRQLGASLPAPRAVLSISAHWYVPGVAVTAMAEPRTIHDFFGFPRELFDIRYPARGDPKLAARVSQLLAPLPVEPDQSWGLDHGTWSVLVHIYPEATVPVVQLSIDSRQPAQFHYELGRRLAPLREEGVLILGSGNVVHNLSRVVWEPDAAPYDWAVEFAEQVRADIARGEHQPLIDYRGLGAAALAAVPTPEHYLPLLYVLGSQTPGEVVQVPIDGIELGSIGMMSVVVGSQAESTADVRQTAAHSPRNPQ